MRTWHTFPWRKSDERAERPCESVPLAANDRKTIPSIDPPWCKTRREWRKGTCIARRSACNCPEREGERERPDNARFIAARILSESDSPPRRSSIYEAGEGANRNDKPFESRSSRESGRAVGRGIDMVKLCDEKEEKEDGRDGSIDRFRAGWIEKQWSILLPDFREI